MFCRNVGRTCSTVAGDIANVTTLAITKPRPTTSHAKAVRALLLKATMAQRSARSGYQRANGDDHGGAQDDQHDQRRGRAGQAMLRLRQQVSRADRDESAAE